MIHISKSKKCKEAYSDEEIDNLKASQKGKIKIQSSQRKENEAKEKCIACKQEFQSLLKHIARTANKKCQKAYSQDDNKRLFL